MCWFFCNFTPLSLASRLHLGVLRRRSYVLALELDSFAPCESNPRAMPWSCPTVGGAAKMDGGLRLADGADARCDAGTCMVLLSVTQ